LNCGGERWQISLRKEGEGWWLKGEGDDGDREGRGSALEYLEKKGREWRVVDRVWRFFLGCKGMWRGFGEENIEGISIFEILGLIMVCKLIGMVRIFV
jgi:hypothetical protein